MISPETSPIGTELLDDPAADPRAAAASLRNIARANRWFGGRAAAWWGVQRFLRLVPAGRAVLLLDIGTGSGDIPCDLRLAAARRGHRLHTIGLERSPVAARLAADAGLPTMLACAGALPVRARAVDLVLLSQVSHHLAPDAAVQLFRAVSQLARVGVVVADLFRSEAAVAAFHVGSAVLGFDAITRADGITSVRRGYTVEGLRALVARAGYAAAVQRRPGFRIVATWSTA